MPNQKETKQKEREKEGKERRPTPRHSIMQFQKRQGQRQDKSSREQCKQSFSSVQFGRSVVSDSLPPHRLKHAKLPCPSPTPGACSNSCPSSPWCHPTISSSVIPFSCRLQSSPASGSFPMSQFFTSNDRSIWSFSFSNSPSSEKANKI